MMFAVIEIATGEAAAFVYETEGYDAEIFQFVPLPDDNPDAWQWDVATQSLIARPEGVADATFNSLAADPRWAALKGATPAQVETWLDTNVTDLASARTVFKFMLLALKVLANNPRAGI